MRAVADLFRRSFGTLSFLPTLHTPSEDRTHFARVIAEQEVWVHEGAGGIDGFAALEATLLTGLYVDPSRLRQGIGSALLEHAKMRRPAGLQLWVFQRNAGARWFYERHGFSLVELTDGSTNEEREPDALYEWRP